MKITLRVTHKNVAKCMQQLAFIQYTEAELGQATQAYVYKIADG